jgi:hypothetical protein
MSEIRSNDLLKNPQQVFIIDLLEPALCLEQTLLDSLIDNPKGLYFKGQLEPFIYDNQDYYVVDENMNRLLTITKTHLDDYLANLNIRNNNIEFDNCSITDKYGKVVISFEKINKNKRLITEIPTYPVTAVNMVANVLLSTLYKVCVYNNSNINLHKLVKDEYSYLVDNEVFHNSLDYYISKLLDFIGDDTFHIYFHKKQGCSLIIEKIIDYRIYGYYKLLEEKEENHNQELRRSRNEN